MSNFMICVEYIAKEDCREKFLGEIVDNGIDGMIRKEEGCVNYAYYKSLPNENEILLMEEWVSEEHQKAHLKQPHMDKLREIKEKYIESTRIGRLFLESDIQN